MNIVQSPERPFNCLTKNKLFLAGGISDCPDWQSEVCDALKGIESNTTVYNPRRKYGLCKDGEDAKEQILWEHKYLLNSTHILFWFPEETLCPITLYELGKYVALVSTSGRPCDNEPWYGKKKDPSERFFIGIHPNYKRKFDLEIQLPLVLPHVKIDYNLNDLIGRVIYDLQGV